MPTLYRYSRRGWQSQTRCCASGIRYVVTGLSDALFPPSGVRGCFQATWPLSGLLGDYWSATERGHVICESRWALARLLFADFEVNAARVEAAVLTA